MSSASVLAGLSWAASSDRRSIAATCRFGRPLQRGLQNGVMDRVLHPVEPLAIRLTIAGQF
jgi:hypothetical protein